MEQIDMTEKMLSIPIRFDKDFYDIIIRKANERGIKVSRYVRMLIERGLVIDHQYHNEGNNSSATQIDDKQMLTIIAELCAETTMMVRYLYRQNFENDEAFKDMVSKIYNQSQQLLEMMKSNLK